MYDMRLLVTHVCVRVYTGAGVRVYLHAFVFTPEEEGFGEAGPLLGCELPELSSASGLVEDRFLEIFSRKLDI